MIRSLHIIDHLGLGGAQAVLLDLARALPDAGVGVEVAVLHGGGPFFDALRAGGTPVRSLAPSKWPPVYLPALTGLARAGKFDVVHFHLQGSNWLAKPIFAAFGDCPLVAHDHSSGDLRFRGIGSLLPDALTHACSSRIVAVSRGVRDFLCAYEAVDPARIEVVPNGIDTRTFAPADPATRRAARARFGLGEGDFAVGAIGRLSPEKNFSVLADLSRGVPRAEFLVAGDGPLRGELEFVFAGTRVRLLGGISDRPGFYAALDALVIPSLYEGLPMVLLEAMACGLPVVASALPDISDALDEAGVLANPADPGSFVDALRRLAASPALGGQLGRAARERCERDHSAAAMAGSVARIYRESLGECVP